jgi:hypothetical protein
MLRIPSQAAISSAITGTAQIQGSPAQGRSRGGVPHQPRIEDRGGQHRQGHDGGEADDPGFGVDRRQETELQGSCQDRHHEHVDVGPAPDKVDQPIEDGPLAQPTGRTPPDGVEEPAERGKLQHRHENRGEEHEQRQRPHAELEELIHAGQDGVAVDPAKSLDRHHRQQVCRKVEDHGGGGQGEGSAQTAGLTRLERRGTARAGRRATGGSGRRRRHHQLTTVAHDPGLARLRGKMPRIADHVPDPPDAERHHQQSLHQHESAERVAAARDIRVDRIRQAAEGDIGAEQVDVEHAPRIEHQSRLPQRRQPRPHGRIAPSEPGQHGYHEAQPDRRNGKREPGHQHRQPGEGTAVFGQTQRAADQQILARAPFQIDQENRIEIDQQKEDQRGHRQGQRRVEPNRRKARQAAAAADAGQAMPRNDGIRRTMQLTAIAAGE